MGQGRYAKRRRLTAVSPTVDKALPTILKLGSALIILIEKSGRFQTSAYNGIHGFLLHFQRSVLWFLFSGHINVAFQWGDGSPHTSPYKIPRYTVLLSLHDPCSEHTVQGTGSLRRLSRSSCIPCNHPCPWCGRSAVYALDRNL